MTRLEQLRVDRGLTARALANAVGLSHQTIHNIEDRKPTSAPTLKKLADFFDVPATSLTQDATFESAQEAAA